MFMSERQLLWEHIVKDVAIDDDDFLREGDRLARSIATTVAAMQWKHVSQAKRQFAELNRYIANVNRIANTCLKGNKLLRERATK